jgi:putative selenium metabolism hydrolase
MQAADIQELTDRAAGVRDEILGFAADLIRTPGFSGEEAAVAELALARMRDLGFDEVFSDEAGNVIGLVKGIQPGRTVILVTHLDTARPTDLSEWEHDPYAGMVADGYLHGLGSSSNKAALSAQVFAAALLKRAGLAKGDVVVASVVHSERGECLGIGHLFDQTLPSRRIRPDFVIMGDPTGLDLYLGHRGRCELEIATIGRTSHSSSPWLGLNAAYKMIPVLEGIEELATALPSHPFLERSTVAVTDVTTLPRDAGLIPDRCIARIDRRFLPGESLDAIVSQLQTILTRVSARDPEFSGEVRVRTAEERTYTGLARIAPKVMAAWAAHEDHPYIVRAASALADLGQHPRFDKWYFATDGSYAGGTLGLPTVGYSPGEERYSHTPFDRVKVDYVLRAAAGTAAVAAAIAEG